MAVRITTYIDESTAEKLNRYDNKSKLMKEALNMYFINKEYFLKKHRTISNKIKELEFKLENEKIELDFMEKQLEEIEKIEQERPKNYHKIIGILKSVPYVTDEDIRFQAERLNVDMGQLKSWIWLDGYYDEIYNR